MECDICHTRSSEGYCVQCNRLLCAECAAVCSRCGNLMCPDHAHETRSGRILCPECLEERRERREKRKAAERAATKEGEQETADEAEEEAVVLTASAAKGLAPWKISAAAGMVALLLIVVAILRPGFRVGGLGFTAVLVLVVAAGSLFWGAVGLFYPKYYEERALSLIGIGFAFVAVVCAVLSIGHEARQALEEKASRDKGPRPQLETDAERRAYRQRMLRGEMPEPE